MLGCYQEYWAGPQLDTLRPSFLWAGQLPIKWWVDSHDRMHFVTSPKLLGLAVNAIPAVRRRSAPPRPNRGEVPSCIPLPPTLCSSPFDSRFRGAALALLLARACGFLSSCLLGWWVSWLLLRCGFFSASLAFLAHPQSLQLLFFFDMVVGAVAARGSFLVDFRAASLLLPSFLVVLAIRSCLHC